MKSGQWPAIGILLWSNLVAAHPLSPEAPCTEPVRPPRTDIERWNEFVDAVDTYRDCIASFSTSEYAASEGHRRAAERATERWNHFVRDNLNVPADFPHQSDKTSAP